MKKIILAILFLFLIGVAEAAISLNVSWQLSSSTVRPGGNSIIYLTLTNPGVDLTNVIITSTAGPYVKIISGSKIELGDISSTSSQQASISVTINESAETTVSYVYLDVAYYYSNSQYKKTFYIPLTIKRDPVLEISNIEFNDTVEPGKTFLLSFDISNKGDSNARELRIELNKTTLFTTPGLTGEIIINELKSLESKNLNFLITINPDADIGIESIPITLSYYDDTKTNNYTESKNIGLKISGNIDFIVTVNSYKNFYYGHVGEVSVSLSNRGLAPAEYISVNAYSDFGSKEFYIGSLDPDDSETINLPQDLSKASEKYPIHLTLEYKDKFDNEYSLEKTVEVMPTNAPIDYNIFLILIAVLVVVYWFYRRRKKK